MPQTIRIIIAATSDEDTLPILGELRLRQLTVTHARVDSLEAMAHALRNQAWDIIIFEYPMPGFDVFAALALSRNTGHDLPLLVISSDTEDEKASDILTAGVDSFILKSDFSRLATAVTQALTPAKKSPASRPPEPITKTSLPEYHDATNQKVPERGFEYHRDIDSLTGLPNRNMLGSGLGQAAAAASLSSHQVGVLLIGLDNFKVINESFGYCGGDEALKAFGDRLQACLSDSTMVFRLSGDEFIVVLPRIDEAMEARIFAQKLLDITAKPYSLDGQEFFLSFGIGISVYPRDGENSESLINNAYVAMRRAKQLGRGKAVFYTREFKNSAAGRLALENQLRRALENNEFALYYQPQFDLNTTQIIGVETLIRWQHSTRGLLTPDQFIPLAEDIGLMDPIGEWMISTACLQNKAWQREGLPPLRLAVNISSYQFRQKAFFDRVARALRESKLEPKYLDLEITESMMMHDIQTSAKMLEKIKTLGVRISIDDFGTGYSSLNYLKRLPVDAIKIDKPFVQGVTVDPDDAAIVQAIIAMSHKLRLFVFAEGVETEGQLRFLAHHGCDGAQGFIFSQSLPAEEFIRFARQNWHFSLSHRNGASGERILLIVDDEPNVRAALARLLRGSGYRILAADSGKAALELLAVNSVGVILSDHRMPEMSGIEFLKRVKELHPNVIRILLSGFIDVQVVTDAINEGAVYKFLAKPWEDSLLRNTLREAFELFEASHRTRHSHAD